MSSGAWQISATYVKGLSRALRELHHDELVRERASAQTREVLRQPLTQSWWPGTVLAETMEALGAEVGRTVAARTSFDTMGPLVRPLAGVVLTLSKSPIEALLKRLPVFVGAGVQGVTTNVALAPHEAVVTFTFPEPVPEVMSAVWYGMFEVGFQLAKQGALAGQTIEAAKHVFTIRW